MIFYRLFLYAESQILAGRDFHAENDDIACAIVAIVADGCADECDGFELWDGTRLVLNDAARRALEIFARAQQAAEAAKLTREHTERSLSSLRETLEASAVLLEEALMNSSSRLRSSERLNGKVAHIRAKPRPA